MKHRDRVRRQWTHRRLGLGAAFPTDAAMARSDALLTAVGARRTSIDFLADPFDVALFDFARDLDLLARVAEADATPIPLAALRSRTHVPVKRRLTWRLLVPTISSGLAVSVLTVLLLVGASSSPATPTLSAASESKSLLTHAGLLLSAATTATAADRAKLVIEAKADLTHVARLLPLAAPQEQPAIQAQMNVLNRRARPLAAEARPPDRSAEAGSASGSGDASRQAPTQHTATQRVGQQSDRAPAARQRPVQGAPADSTGSSTVPAGGQSSGTRPPPGSNGDAQPQPGGTGASSPPRSGTGQPPPAGGGANPSGPSQPPPPGGQPAA